MKALLTTVISLIFLVGIYLFCGCKGSRGPEGPAGPSGQVTNAVCLDADCHGNTGLTKILRPATGDSVVIPLYVDSAKYAATTHGGQLCSACHTDINAVGGAHAPVQKVYGGWARLGSKEAVESYQANEVPQTPNYQTAASLSCVTCHQDQAPAMNSAHATIFKHREAKVDGALSIIAGKTCGEDYTVGDCNRCHASCSTCHFKSTITRAATGSPLDYWDQNQTSYPASGFSDKMSEFKMDWTTNVSSHDFLTAAYFQTKAGNIVCEACHTGFDKPSANAYYWTDEAQTAWDSLTATDIKRHPQIYELEISGDPSYTNGGNNTTHAGMACTGCHGGTTGDVHSVPGVPYLWSERGDVQCTDCHNPTTAHSNNANVALHFDGDGKKVACIGCHTFGLSRDFSGGGHDVFLDPITNEVRPVVNKHGIATAWYSHNWQKLDQGTGRLDPNGDCAKKCHYEGNKVGASHQ